MYNYLYIYFSVCLFRTNITLLFNWMGQGRVWIERWRKARRFLQRVVRVRLCVRELRRSRLSRLTGHSALCKYWISCLSAPHVCRVWLSPAATCAPGMSSLRCSARRKSWSVGVWILPLKPTLLLSSLPVPQERGNCHERSPPSRDLEAKSTIPPVFFHSNLF